MFCPYIKTSLHYMMRAEINWERIKFRWNHSNWIKCRCFCCVWKKSWFCQQSNFGIKKKVQVKSQCDIKLNKRQLPIFFPASIKKSPYFILSTMQFRNRYLLHRFINQTEAYLSKWQNYYDCALCIICTKASYSCRVCCSGQHTGRILQRMLEKS